MVTRPWLPVVGDRCWKRAVISLAPCGTSRWNAKGCRVSRTHSTLWPLAVISSPASWAMGPTGPWLPGSHSGKNSTSGPARSTGMVSVTSKMRRFRSVASTCSRTTPGQGASCTCGSGGSAMGRAGPATAGAGAAACWATAGGPSEARTSRLAAPSSARRAGNKAGSAGAGGRCDPPPQASRSQASVGERVQQRAMKAVGILDLRRMTQIFELHQPGVRHGLGGAAAERGIIAQARLNLR